MNTKRVICYNVITMGSLLLLAVGGCKVDTVITYTPVNNTKSEEYHTFSATGIPRFSFEYPVDYVITSYQPMPEFPGTSVMLRVPEPIQGMTAFGQASQYESCNSIDILIAELCEIIPTAEIAVDECIEEWKELELSGRANDFKIIYKRQVMVGGIQGWEIKLSLTTFPQGWGVVAYDVPIYLIVREVYFDYQGMSFNIALISGANIINETDKAYEYILGTFKLLE